MRYHTTADNIRIAFDGDSADITLTLTSDDGGPVIIKPYQTGLIKLVRRGINDLYECAALRERERTRVRDAEGGA